MLINACLDAWRIVDNFIYKPDVIIFYLLIVDPSFSSLVAINAHELALTHGVKATASRPGLQVSTFRWPAGPDIDWRIASCHRSTQVTSDAHLLKWVEDVHILTLGTYLHTWNWNVKWWRFTGTDKYWRTAIVPVEPSPGAQQLLSDWSEI